MKAFEFLYRRLTDIEQDIVLKLRFRLAPDEMEAGRNFRAFTRQVLGIETHVGQVAFAGRVLARHPANPVTAKFLTLVLAAGNRAGKTSLLAMLIIFCCLRKTNRPILTALSSEEEAERWLRMEYHWYHFAIQQEVADLVFNDMVRILSGTHEGQRNGCPLTQNGPVAQWDAKEYGDYRWLRFGTELGGAQVHFRTTGEKALGSLGKDMHGLSFDEAGLERNLDFLIKEVFDFRRLGTGGQLLMASTPSEDLGTTFADNWDKGSPENRDRLPGWCSMRMSSRDNVGYGLDKGMFDRLIENVDERTIRQNIDGEFLQAKAAYFNGENVDRVFDTRLPERSPAVDHGVYLQGADPSKQKDSMWDIVLKLVPNRDNPLKPYLVGVYADQKQGQKSTETMVALVADGFDAFEGGVRARRMQARCYTAIDATGFGGKMFRERLDEEIPSVTNIEFGGTVQKKRKLLGDLRTLIDEGRLILPKTGIWLIVRRQLLGYKLEDKGIEQDAVMALVCAIALLRRTPADGQGSADFDLFGVLGPELSEPSAAAELAHARLAARSRD